MIQSFKFKGCHVLQMLNPANRMLGNPQMFMIGMCKVQLLKMRIFCLFFTMSNSAYSLRMPFICKSKLSSVY